MGITHLSGLQVGGVPTMGMASLPAYTGKWYFVDPAHGSDGNEGTSDSPFATLYKAYAVARSGYNDVIALVGNGGSTGSARMSVALAQTVDSTATTGTITWAKNALHLIGIAPPGFNSRARIAPPTGTYTAATFGNSGNMFNVTATGCHFINFSVYNGFSTGAAGQIAWIDAGGRNTYVGVSFLGMNDAASAADTGSRSLKISGSTGENTFINCYIGDDTTQRTAANYSLEFTGGSPRNKFTGCVFPAYTNQATACAVTVGASGIDRWAIFEECVFINATLGGPGSTTMTDVFNIGASPGGVVFLKGSQQVGHTGWASTVTNVVTADPAVNSGAGIAAAVAA